MLQKKVFEIYKKMFSVSDEVVDSWVANGYNSIRIRFKNKKELVFTYKNKSRWRLESRENFIDSICKEELK